MVDFAPQYIRHVRTAIETGQPMLLAKIVGVYRIGFRNSVTGHAQKRDVLVMENLLYKRRVSMVYDLKGEWRGGGFTCAVVCVWF